MAMRTCIETDNASVQCTWCVCVCVCVCVSESVSVSVSASVSVGVGVSVSVSVCECVGDSIRVLLTHVSHAFSPAFALSVTT